MMHHSYWLDVIELPETGKVSSTIGLSQPIYRLMKTLKPIGARYRNKGEWIQTDLEAIHHSCRADQLCRPDATLMGKQTAIFHQYKLFSSNDGVNWKMLIDKSITKLIYLMSILNYHSCKGKIPETENIHMPTGKFAISGFVCLEKGPVPDTVQHFVVLGAIMRRNSWLKWQVNAAATGYMIYTGIAPDKLYTSIMVYGTNEYYFSAMEKNRPYYFQIEAFNENGIVNVRTKN